MCAEVCSELISVIVPVYNSQNYIERCVNSLIAQTYENIEIIIIDDGSTDKSGGLCDALSAGDERIRVIHKKNEGVSAARNTGLDIAKGRFVAFVDSDDYVEINMLEQMIHQQRKSAAKIVACGYYHERNGKITFPARPMKDGYCCGEKAVLSLISRYYYCGFLWNKLFAASLFCQNNEAEAIRLDEGLSYCEDLLFVAMLVVNGADIFYDAKPLYHYCVRDDGLTASTGVGRETELIARGKIVELVKESGKRQYDFAQAKYTEALVDLYQWACILKDGKKATLYKNEALNRLREYYFNPDITLFEKIRIFLKLYFPIAFKKC